MVGVSVELITGLALGIEHDAGQEEDDHSWAIVVHLGIFRIIFISFKPD